MAVYHFGQRAEQQPLGSTAGHTDNADAPALPPVLLTEIWLNLTGTAPRCRYQQHIPLLLSMLLHAVALGLCVAGLQGSATQPTPLLQVSLMPAPHRASATPTVATATALPLAATSQQAAQHRQTGSTRTLPPPPTGQQAVLAAPPVTSSASMANPPDSTPPASTNNPATNGSTPEVNHTPASASSSANPDSDTPVRFDADYLHNPSPAYPLSARRRGVQGEVLLRVQVAASGLPTQVEIATSSGNSSLDHAAQETVRNWRFVPASRNGQAMNSEVLVPVAFRLQGG